MFALPPSKPRRPRSGRLTILAIFFFGALFLAGLFLARAHMRSERYRLSIPGTPPLKIRVVTCDLARLSGGLPTAISQIKSLDPDFVLLQHVTESTLPSIQSGLAFAKSRQTRVYFGGCAILAKDFNALYNPCPVGPTSGAVGEAVLAGRRFLVASVALQDQQQLPQLNDAWDLYQKLPKLIGISIDSSNKESPAAPDGSAILSPGPWSKLATGRIGPILWADFKQAPSTTSPASQSSTRP